MSGIEGWFHDNPNVKIITNLDDIGQPYSCNQWGNQHLNFDAIPLITDDGNDSPNAPNPNILWGWFNTGFAFPSTVYIDHNMTVYFKANNPSPSTAIATIDAMLSECGQACVLAPPSALYDYAIDGNTVSSTNSNGNIVLDPNGTGTVDVSGAKITTVGTPSQSTDAATKGYVDGVINGLDVKNSVQFASTANVAGTYNNANGTITAGSNGALSMDGGSPSIGDRVLLKDQTSNVQNGIYTVTTAGSASAAYILTRAKIIPAVSKILIKI